MSTKINSCNDLVADEMMPHDLQYLHTTLQQNADIWSQSPRRCIQQQPNAIVTNG